jgi:hypothetical protein
MGILGLRLSTLIASGIFSRKITHLNYTVDRYRSVVRSRGSSLNTETRLRAGRQGFESR